MIKITFSMGARHMGSLTTDKKLKLSEAMKQAGVQLPKGYRVIKRTKLANKEYQVYPGSLIPASANLFIVPSRRGDMY